MKRLSFAIAVMAILIALRPVDAELENHVFTSRADRLELVVPRGWRESDAPSYPGLLLWMMRPDAKIVLTAEPFTRELYCSWPVTCRTSHEVNTMPGKLACALRQKLTNARMRIGPVQAGPKENEEVGLPSVWFEYDDGKHFMRQAVMLADDRAISLVLSTTTPDARASQIRSFEQTLRTLRPLSTAELSSAASGSAASVPGDAGVGGDGGVPSADLAPAAKINPVGPCN
jgi:hypothetical protein